MADEVSDIDPQLGTIRMPADGTHLDCRTPRTPEEPLCSRSDLPPDCRRHRGEPQRRHRQALRLNLTRDGEVRPPPRKRAAKGQRPKSGPRLRYQMLKALYGEPQPAADDEPIHNGHCCSLLEFSEERCRWPTLPGLPTSVFAATRRFKGLPYCAGHTRLAYRPGSRQRVVRG